MHFFDSTDVGIIANRFSQDLQLIDMEVPLALFNVTIGKCSQLLWRAKLITPPELITCIAQVILIAATAKYISPALVICVVVFWLIQKFYLRTSRQVGMLFSQSYMHVSNGIIAAPLGNRGEISSFLKIFGGSRWSWDDPSISMGKGLWVPELGGSQHFSETVLSSVLCSEMAEPRSWAHSCSFCSSVNGCDSQGERKH